jgi:pyruvate dehydrogenase E2 component (dihydrolipoamide acetyltransferase)
MEVQLGKLMQRCRDIALKGDVARCTEHIEGVTIQERGFRTEGRFGRHLVLVDEPTSFGGTDSAANPAELLLAALGASLSVTLRCHAALLGIHVGRIRVELAGDLDIRGFFDADPAVRSGFAELRLHVQLESDASAEALARLMAAAERGCPVLDACRSATSISIELIR